MKAMVVYSSLTGNTKKIAQSIWGVMPEGTEIYAVENAPSPAGYDFIAMGFWVDKGTADSKAQEYMTGIKKKKVGMFATLGAEPGSRHARDVLERGRELLADNEIVAEFICQGKIDPKLIQVMAKVHPMTPERKKRHEEAAKHPNEEDCENARKVFGADLRAYLQSSG